MQKRRILIYIQICIIEANKPCKNCMRFVQEFLFRIADVRAPNDESAKISILGVRISRKIART